MLIGIRPERIDEYKRLHAAVWPQVIEQIKRCNISNYTIYLREPENILFSHFEYHGQDFEADMAAMARDPETQPTLIGQPNVRPMVMGGRKVTTFVRVMPEGYRTHAGLKKWVKRGVDAVAALKAKPATRKRGLTT